MNAARRLRPWSPLAGTLALYLAAAPASTSAADTPAAAATAPAAAPSRPPAPTAPPEARTRLLVLQKNAELLSGFDPDTGDRSGPAIRVFAIPHEMAVTADGAQLFITNYGAKSFRDADRGANMLTIVDAHRVAHLGTVDLGDAYRPHGIARGRSGRFYVTADQPAGLLVIDPIKRAVVARYPLDQKLPHMVVVTADERRALVANAGSGTVSVVPIDGSPETAKGKIQNVAIGGTPMGMALTDDGRWCYASNRDGNQIARIDLRQLRVTSRIAVAGQPSRLALADHGRVLVASAIAGDAIVAIDTRKGREIARVAVGRRPEALLLDPEHQRGFVSAQDDDKVVEFSTIDWKVVREIRTGDHPDSMWLDRAPAPPAAMAEIDGSPTPLFTAARLALLPEAQRAAWTRYLDTSTQRRATDQALIAGELRATGKRRMVPAPYRHAFRFDDKLTPAWLASPEGRQATASLISFQTPSGGWSKHVDLLVRSRQPAESFYSENEGWNYIATFDNDSTTEQMRYLAAAFAATSDPAVRAAFARALEYLFAAQFPNGCWPQVYPLQGGYHDAITYNDDAIVNIMRVLDDVAGGRVAAATPEQARRAAVATARGLSCIVASQVVDGGVRTIWGQQSDPLTLEPAPARKYELAGLAGRESATLVGYLMSLPAPPAAVVEAVHAAADWFRAHSISGYDYDGKNGLRANPQGGLIWARLSELGSARPIFSNRDGVKRYDWRELTDRRFGYTWFCKDPRKVLDQYPEWAQRHPRAPQAPKKN
jgi:PelA/Pel-15E family pectate lyase